MANTTDPGALFDSIQVESPRETDPGALFDSLPGPKTKIGMGERLRLNAKQRTGADETTGSAVAGALSLGLNEMGRTIQDGALQQLYKGKKKTLFRGEQSFADMSDGELTNMATFAGIHVPFAQSALKDWDQSEGAKIADPKERRAARVAHVQGLATEVLKERLQNKRDAGQELSNREKTLWAKIGGGFVENAGYTGAFMVGAPMAIGTSFGRRFGDLTNDEQSLDASGSIETKSAADSIGTASVKAAAGGVAEYAIENTLGKVYRWVGGKAIGKAISGNPAAKEALAKLANSGVGRAFGKFYKLGEVTGTQSLPEEVFENFEGDLVDDGFGLGKRESEKLLGWKADSAETTKKFFTKENLGDQALEMLMQVAIGGAAAGVTEYKDHAQERNRVDGVLLAMGADPAKLKTAPLADKQQVAAAIRQNLTPEIAKKALERLGNKAGQVYDGIVEQDGYDFDAKENGIVPNFAMPEPGADTREELPDGSRLHEDEDSGIGVVEHPDGKATVYDRNGAMQGGFASVGDAVNAANKLSVRNQVTDLRREQKAKFAETTAARLAGDMQVEIHNTTDDLVAALPGIEKSEDFGSNPSGVERDGVIHLVLDNINTPRGVVSTILHEAGVHAGLAKVLKGGAKSSFLSNLSSEEVAGYEDWVSRRGYLGGQDNTEEALAYMYEKRLGNPTGFQKGIKWLRDQLRKVNPDVAFNDADIEVMMQDAQMSVQGTAGAVKRSATGTNGQAGTAAKGMANASADAKARRQEEDEQNTRTAPPLNQDEEAAPYTLPETVPKPAATSPVVEKAEKDSIPVVAEPAAEAAGSPVVAETRKEPVQAKAPEAAPAQAAPQAKPAAAAPDAPTAIDTARTFKDRMNADYPAEDVNIDDTLVNAPGFVQFKEDADPITGEVSGQELKGEPLSLAENPIVVMELNDGRKVVVTGRHRRALYKRHGKKTIPAHIIRESQGWTPEEATALDGFLNILDEKGTLHDYVNFFDRANLTESEARRAGLVDRPKGQSAWSLFEGAGQDLRAATDFSGDRQDGIRPEQAAVIARIAPAKADPRNESIQRLGIKKALGGMKEKLLADYMRVITRNSKGVEATNEQGDFFDAFGDTFLQDAEKEAKYISGKIAKLTEVRRVLSAAINNPDSLNLTPKKASEMGIRYFRDPSQLKPVRDELDAEITRWSADVLDPDLVAEARKGAGLNVAPPLALESVTKDQLDEEAKKRADAQKVADGAAEPLTGTAGDLTPDMFGPSETPLFDDRRDTPPSPAPVAKPVEAAKPKPNPKKTQARDVPKKDETPMTGPVSGLDGYTYRISQIDHGDFDGKYEVTVFDKANIGIMGGGQVDTPRDAFDYMRNWADGQIALLKKTEKKPKSIIDNARKPVVVKSPVSNLSAEDQDSLAAIRAEIRKKLRGQANMGFDPEILTLSGRMAILYAKGGIKTFSQFANVVKSDMADLWDQMKQYLHSAWQAAGATDDTLDDVSRKEAAAVIAALDTVKAEAQTTDGGQNEHTNDNAESGPAAGSKTVGEVGASPDLSDGSPIHQPGADSGSGVVLEGAAPKDVPPSGSGRKGTGKKAGRPSAASGKSGSVASDGRGADDSQRSESGSQSGSDAATGGLSDSEKSTLSAVQGGDKEVADHFHISDISILSGNTQMARFDKNRKAIDTYKSLVESGKTPTTEEKNALAAYVGWGSFGQELFEGSWDRPDPARGWEDRDQWLRSQLGREEWESAQTSIVNAHYTDPVTVQTIWDIVKRIGFRGGRVLEPSTGIGNFFGLMPQDLKSKSSLTAIEMDRLVAGMFAKLYPGVNLAVQPYQDSTTPDNFYDIVIGNWPFLNIAQKSDPRYAHLSPMLHDYFFLKALDQVRPGGLVIGITSAGTMDKSGEAVRASLAMNAELVASFRMPSGAFEGYAGTKVVTDLIILRKRSAVKLDVSDESWVKTEMHEVPDRLMGTYQPNAKKEIRLNRYYIENPTHVLGTIAHGRGTTSPRPGMIVERTKDFPQRLAAIPEFFKADTYQPRTADNEKYTKNDSKGERRNSIVSKGGKLYQVKGEHMLELTASSAKVFAKKEYVEQLHAAIKVRVARDLLMEAQLKGSDNEEQLRTTLATEYRNFVSKYGRFHGSRAEMAMQELKDPNLGRLQSLEIPAGKGVNGKTVYRDASILSKPSMRHMAKAENATIGDAYTFQRNESLDLDVKRIAAISKSTEDEVIKSLSDSGAIFKTPYNAYEHRDRFLEGNIRVKLRAALTAKEGGMEGLDDSIKLLEDALPENTPYYNISVKIGAPWITPEDYRLFAAKLLNIPAHNLHEVAVSEGPGGWTVTADRHHGTPEASTVWGTSFMPFHKIMQHSMNNTNPTVWGKDEKGNRYVIEGETAKAVSKVEAVRSEFLMWLWKDSERRVRLERQYNENVNCVAKKASFSGAHLSLAGMALTRGEDPFSLREHQVNAAYRGVVTGRGIFAHEVGTGKTYTMGMLSIEGRRFGRFKKPVLFAHNANSADVSADIQSMYPGAHILYVDNLSNDTKAETLEQIATEEWDLVVIPHSVMPKLKLKMETIQSLAEEEIRELEDAAIEAAQADGIDISVDEMDKMGEETKEAKSIMRKLGRSPTAKALVKQREQILESIKAAAANSSDPDAIFFEDLGIDAIIVDEAHEFKKLPIATKQKLKGLNTSASKRGNSLFFLTEYVKRMNNGNNTYLFTGTPITNTINEIYNMMRYAMSDVMKRVNLKKWDNWFNTFAAAETDVELLPTGEYDSVTRLSSFVNVPELQRMAGQYMDVVFADEMPEFKPRSTASGKTLTAKDLTPEERAFLTEGVSQTPNGRPYKRVITDVAKMSKDQSRIRAELDQRYRLFKTAQKRERKEMMLSGSPNVPIRVETDANKTSLDVRMFDMSLPDSPESKMSRCVKNVMKHYGDGDGKAVQAIFVQTGDTNKAKRSLGRDAAGEKQYETVDKYNFVKGMIDRLVSEGIPRNQIAVIDGSVTKEKRKEIAAKACSGELRVIIGQTQTMGTGVNMQTWLRAMHHIDAPYMPGDLEQRNGRGWRQGNKFNTVLEYRYVTAGIDGRRWQILLIKDRFIKMFLRNKSTRVIDGDAVDMGEEGGSDFTETLGAAAGDPRIMQRAKLENSVKKLMEQRRIHEVNQDDAATDAGRIEDRIAELKPRLAMMSDFVTKYKATVGKPFSMTIDGVVYDKRDAAEAALVNKMSRIDLVALRHGNRSLTIVEEYRGHKFVMTNGGLIAISGHEWQDSTNLSSTYGMDGLLLAVSNQYAKAPQKLADQERSLVAMQDAAQSPFANADALAKKKQDLDDMIGDLTKFPMPPPEWLYEGAPSGTGVFVGGQEYTVAGHRWGKEDFYVKLIAEDGNRVWAPYQTITDENGQRVYDDVPFTSPVTDPHNHGPDNGGQPPPDASPDAPPPPVGRFRRGDDEVDAADEPRTIGTTKEYIDARREAVGLDPIVSGDPETNEESLTKARNIFDDTPQVARDLIDEMKRQPRALKPYERSILLLQNAQIEFDLAQADKSGIEAADSNDAGRVEESKLLRERAMDAMADIDRALRDAGSESGRSLQAIQMRILEDYSLASMLRRARAENGFVPLTPEQQAEVLKLNEQYQKTIKALQAKIDAQEAQQKDAGAAGAIRDMDGDNRTAKASGALRGTPEGKAQGEKTQAEIIEDIIAVADAADGWKEIEGLPNLIQQLARWHVENGVRELNKLVELVRADVHEWIPDMTHREIRDIISNYGKTSKMSQDEVSKALRELKAQALKVSAIEDVLRKLAPLKTGLQRDEQSQKVRELTKELHQRMKEAGITNRDPDKQLKSAMDAIKTRLTNQIADIDKAIRTGKKLVNVTPGVPYDTEATSLKAQRDALKAIYDEMFPKAPMTDAQRLQVAVKATQRSLDAWDAKVKAAERGEFPGKSDGPTMPKSKILDAMKASRKALRAEFDRLDDLAHPGLSPEEKAIRNYKRQLERSTARYQDKILRGDFAAKAKAERPLDEEGLKLKQANDQVRERYTALLRKYKLDQGLWTTRLMKRTVTPVFDFSREIKSAFDLSAVGRQGWFLAVSHPVIAANAMAKMFEAIKSEHKAYLVDESIKARPNYEAYLRAKLYIAPLETAANVNEHEEMYRSSWAKRIPGVRMSERTFVTFLNLLRADSFDVLTQSGFSGRAPTLDEQKIVASYINIATGRGDFGKYAAATELLATALWSPRLQLSRLQLLAGQPIYHGTAATRKLIGMEYAKSVTGIAMAILLGMLMAPDDEESADKWDIFATAFAKIKIGATRVDLTAGLSSYIVAIARVVMGKKTTSTGRHVKLRGEGAAFGSSTLGEVGSLARKKASPLVGVIANVLSGSNVIGEKVTPWSTFKDVFFPLSPVEVAQTITSHNLPTGALLASLSIMGIGAQTYPSDSYAEAKVDFTEAKRALKEAKTAGERTAIRKEYPYVGNGNVNDIDSLNTEIHALTKAIKDRTAKDGSAAADRNARDQARIDAKKAKVVSLVTGK